MTSPKVPETFDMLAHYSPLSDDGLHGTHVSDDDLRERVEVMVTQSVLRRPNPQYMENGQGTPFTPQFRRHIVSWMLAVSCAPPPGTF